MLAPRASFVATVWQVWRRIANPGARLVRVMDKALVRLRDRAAPRDSFPIVPALPKADF
jgi:hypothetical protein